MPSATVGSAVSGITDAIGSTVSSGAEALGIGADTAATIGNIAGPALLGAGAGAGIGALAGHPLIGALGGALAGGAYGGFSGAGAGAATAPSDLIDPQTGNYILPPTQIPEGGAIVDPSSGALLTPSDSGYDAALKTIQNPVSAAASTVAGTTQAATGAAGAPKGINSTGLALGALSALGQLFSKPQQAPYGNTPGPAQVAANTGPYFNQPLNAPGVANAAPGRTPVNPWATSGLPANYGTYGGPEQTYFSGNSLNNFGFARGGALSRAAERDFRTGTGAHVVRGPGTTTSDSIPAMLSDEEHVLDAGDVRRLGGGDYNRGHARIDRWRHQLERGQGPLARIVAAGSRR